MNGIRSVYQPLVDLVFPPVCPGCGKLLERERQKGVCFYCVEYHLPLTLHLYKRANEMFTRLRETIFVEQAFSLYYFSEQNPIRRIIHAMKYEGNRNACVTMGEELGKQLLRRPIDNVDYLVPIPLHPSRLRRRGYNQSELMAVGIQRQVQFALAKQVLLRTTKTASQAKTASREERNRNMLEVFSARNRDHFRGKHFLLLDDVMTTGATLLSAAHALFSIPRARVSVATLAYVPDKPSSA